MELFPELITTSLFVNLNAVAVVVVVFWSLLLLLLLFLFSDPCMNSPCVNGGTCTAEEGDYECKCAPGYFGFECQCKYNLQNRFVNVLHLN